MAEYDGIRAKMYEEALEEYPDARNQDIAVMHKYLQPKKGDRVLGFGEGNGFFVPHIAQAIGEHGEYLVTDPSKDQLANLEKKFSSKRVRTQVIGVEGLDTADKYDKAWSFGAFHHCPNQEIAMQNLYNSLIPGGELVLCDVFRNSKLAEHFDGPVAQYCITGHDVKFLGDTYATTIARKAGFKDIRIEELAITWEFTSIADIGRFIYKLHAMTLIPGSQEKRIQFVANGCQEILGIKQEGQTYKLNWPMKALIAQK